MSARFVVSAAVAAVATYFGGPTAGAQAFSLTYAVTGSLDPNKKVSGPRLDDLKAPAVALGSVIVYVEGHPRVAGYYAWESDKLEIAATTTSGGGKGGPGVDSTNFTYEIDCLIILAENPGYVPRRIWSNGALVWTAADDADEGSIDASAATNSWRELTAYTGEDDQLPDPTYETAVGVGNAPAYRGRSSIMIAGLNLGNTGQLPILTFEISKALADPSEALAIRYAHEVAEVDAFADGLQPYGALALAASSRVSGMSGSSVRVVPVGSDGAQGTPNDTARPIDLATAGLGSGTAALMVFGTYDMDAAGFTAIGDGVSFTAALPQFDNWLGGEGEIRFATRANLLAVSTSLAIGAGPSGYDFGDEYLGNQGRIYLYDLTGALQATIEAGIPVESIALADTSCWALAGTGSDGGMVYPWTGIGDTIVAGDPFEVPAGTGHVLFCSTGGALHCVSADAEVYTRSGDAWTLRCTLDDGAATDLGSTGGTQYGADATYVRIAKGVEVEPDAPEFMYTMRSWPVGARKSAQELIDSFAAYYFHSFTHDGGGARAVHGQTITDLGPETPTGTGIDARAYDFSCEALYGYPGDSTGTFDQPYDDWEWDPASQTMIIDRYVADVDELPPALKHDLYRQRASGTVELIEPTLEDVMTRQWERAGLDAALLDASAGAEIYVRALAVSQLTSPRQVMDMLAAAYLMEFVESGAGVRMVARGGEPLATIPYADLGASGGERAEPLPLVRGNELETPAQWSVKFANIDNDYQDGNESSPRLATGSSIVAATELPLGLTPTEAKRLAEVLVTDAYASIIRVGPVGLTREYAALEPTDVVLIQGRTGSTFRVRILKKTEAGGLLTFEGVLDDATAVLSDAVTGGGYHTSVIVRLVAATLLKLLDTSILRDADDGRGIYAAAKPAGSPWSGYALHKSPDDVTFTRIASSGVACVFGECSVVPGAGRGLRVFDEASAIVVDVGDGTLASATRDAVLNDDATNAFAIGIDGRWLIGQFRDAELIGTGTYRLTGLLLGGRGTEQHIGTQVAGDTFVLLNTALLRAPQETIDQDAGRFYKPVSTGKSVASTVSQPFTNHSNGLKPFSPVDVRAARDSGDITFTWQRRTRLQVRMIGPGGVLVPLGEEAMAFSIDVFDDDTFTTIVRTLASLTPTVAYSAADQTTDFGSPQASVSVAVYQLSGAVGRGFAARATL